MLTVVALAAVECASRCCRANDLAALYGARISVPAKMRPEQAAAVDDLVVYLSRMTGEKFTTTEEDAAVGILLRRADSEGVPKQARALVAGKSRESFGIWPEGKSRLWIVSPGDLGLAHGVYAYLEAIGCRWYFPSEQWTIVPSRDDVRITQSITAQPAFRSRLFFGTGGFGGKLPLDPERTLEARWMDWQRRNRFGGEFRVSGHTGEAFNLAYRKQLEAHPEWRAMIDGERVPWSITAKFCAGNKEVVALYVEDRLKSYRRARELDPEGPRSWAVSVEPADGGGHCTAPESLALGSVSDRVFHVANEVARALRKEFPDGQVSLFAYNEHAAPPSVALEPNVYVQVIPYAFQRTGMSPDQLLDAWSRKVSRMGVYDYWSIPDWSHDLPTLDPLGFGPERLRGWHRRGVDSFLCESTFSSGAMGFAWYAGARLAWSPDTDVDALFEEFTSDCFGPAAPPMRRMLRRWSDGFYLNSHELALCYRDVDEAWRHAHDDPAIAARVADFGRYVEYLRRRFDYLQTRPGTDERRAAAQRLMHYLWSIYDSSMIHAFRHSQLLARDEKARGNAELGDAFDWRDAEAPGWSEIHKATDAEIRRLVSAGVKEIQPLDFTSRRFGGKLVRALPDAPLSRVPESETPRFWLNNTLNVDVLAQHDGDVFRPRIAVEKSVRLILTNAGGNTIRESQVETGEDWREQWSQLEFKLPKAGVYHLQINSQKRPFRFAPSGELPLSMPGWSNSQGAPTPRLYFYVPATTKKLAIYANYTAAGPPRFFDPQGVEVQPELADGGGLILLDVPQAMRGAVWSLDRAKCPLGPLTMLNAPASFAFSPETLLVPEEALNE
ncbi:MAG: DUF4838 domain-containing protein [Pirellulaceae bacterium]